MLGRRQVLLRDAAADDDVSNDEPLALTATLPLALTPSPNP